MENALQPGGGESFMAATRNMSGEFFSGIAKSIRDNSM